MQRLGLYFEKVFKKVKIYVYNFENLFLYAPRILLLFIILIIELGYNERI